MLANQLNYNANTRLQFHHQILSFAFTNEKTIRLLFFLSFSLGWLYLNLTTEHRQHLLYTNIYSNFLVFQSYFSIFRKRKTHIAIAIFHHIIFLWFCLFSNIRIKCLCKWKIAFEMFLYVQTFEIALVNSGIAAFILPRKYVCVCAIVRSVRIERNKLNHKQTWHMANEMKITHFLWCHIVGPNFFHSNCFTFNPNRNSRMNEWMEFSIYII